MKPPIPPPRRAETAPRDPLIGTIIADRYRIESKLGQGGMGAVYRAKHVRMRSDFAVKILHPDMERFYEALQRFELEAIAAASLRHPHLVTATDFGQLPSGSHYLVLEYVEGESLADLVSKGPVETLRALRIARQLAKGLSVVHEAGMVHRDVKPENVILTVHDGAPDFVRLLDFGMAKVPPTTAGTTKALTRPGTVLGTPSYMSPEQATAGNVDGRSDLYSLGIMLYEMISGAPPFTGSAKDIMQGHFASPPPPLPESTDAELAALVGRLLEKQKERRPRSAADVEAALSGILERLTPAPAARRTGGHRWMLWAGLGLVAIVGAVGATLAVTGVLPVREDRPPPLPTVAAPPPPAVLAGGGGRHGADPVRPGLARPPKPEVLPWITRAEVGDEAAVRWLEARPEADRSAREWLVLGRAAFDALAMDRGLERYLRAVQLDPDLGAEPRLVQDVRKAANDGDLWEKALRLAAGLGGERGVDILLDVWISTPRSTRVTEMAEQLLATPEVRARASEAASIAIDLREAKGCAAYRALLPRATAHGDSRSFRPLLRLRKTTGCGPARKSDCFRCLRTAGLDEAIRTTNAKPAPRL